MITAITMGLGVMFAFTGCGDDDTIVVYTEAGFAPFEYVKGGKIVCVDVDIMNQLGKKTVFENVSFDTIVDTVSAGKLCNVGAAGISVTEERKAKVAFSKEYCTAKLYVIYKASEESQRRGKRYLYQCSQLFGERNCRSKASGRQCRERRS